MSAMSAIESNHPDPLGRALSVLAGQCEILGDAQRAYQGNGLTVQWGRVMASLVEVLDTLASNITPPEQHAATDKVYLDLMEAAYVVVLCSVEHRLPTEEESGAAMGAITRYRLSVMDEGDLPPLPEPEHQPFDTIPGDAGVHDGEHEVDPPGSVLPPPPPPPGAPDEDGEGD